MTELVLLGNPNTGKTTLYNKLTNSNEHIGNWHGVTVEAKGKGFEVNGEKYHLVDLPGLYSLTAFNPEEQVSIDYIFKSHSKIINICDINNITHNMYLTLQLIEAGFDVYVLVNIMDDKVHFDIVKSLKKCFGKRIIFKNVQKAKDLKTSIHSVIQSNSILNIGVIDYLKQYSELGQIIKNNAKSIGVTKEFASTKIVENDIDFIERLGLTSQQLSQIENISTICNQDKLFKQRYEFIQKIIVPTQKASKIYGTSSLDQIMLNRYLGIPIFFCIMILIFYLTFGPLGNSLKDGFSYLIQDSIGIYVFDFMVQNNFNYVFIDFVYKGLICGIGGIMSFLPQIVLLFFFLSLLEQTGYLSRLAFLFEDMLAKIGLSGKSVFALLMSCGCSTVAMMTATNIEDENVKKKTIILSPYICCSAKLPIFIILTSAFFAGNYLVIFVLYLLTIFISLLVAKYLNRSMPIKIDSFILEFPSYKLPNYKKLLSIIWNNTKVFLTKIGGVLLLFSLIFYFLNSYDFNLMHIDLGGTSMMQRFGELFAPLFTPLGFGQWGVVSALISGIVAKEIIVGSMGIINGVGTEGLLESLMNNASIISFTTDSALSFMIFALLYVPCVSSMAVMNKHLGTYQTMKYVGIQFCIAYLCAFIIYWLFKLLAWNMIWVVATFILLVFIVTKSHYHNKCYNCDLTCSKFCLKHLD